MVKTKHLIITEDVSVHLYLRFQGIQNNNRKHKIFYNRDNNVIHSGMAMSPDTHF